MENNKWYQSSLGNLIFKTEKQQYSPGFVNGRWDDKAIVNRVLENIQGVWTDADDDLVLNKLQEECVLRYGEDWINVKLSGSLTSPQGLNVSTIRFESKHSVLFSDGVWNSNPVVETPMTLQKGKWYAYEGYYVQFREISSNGAININGLNKDGSWFGTNTNCGRDISKLIATKIEDVEAALSKYAQNELYRTRRPVPLNANIMIGYDPSGVYPIEWERAFIDLDGSFLVPMGRWNMLLFNGEKWADREN